MLCGWMFCCGCGWHIGDFFFIYRRWVSFTFCFWYVIGISEHWYVPPYPNVILRSPLLLTTPIYPTSLHSVNSTLLLYVLSSLFTTPPKYLILYHKRPYKNQTIICLLKPLFVIRHNALKRSYHIHLFADKLGNPLKAKRCMLPAASFYSLCCTNTVLKDPDSLHSLLFLWYKIFT